MKNKHIVVTVLLALALFAAACGAQQTPTETGDATEPPTVATGEETATEEVSEAHATPTGPAVDSTATQEATGTEAAPTGEASGTGAIPQTGPGDAGIPDDLDEVIRVLRTAGVTVNLADPVESDVLSVAGQIVHINNEEVEFYTYASAEAAEAEASLVADLENPEAEPQFYKLGNMLVRYVGSDTLVRDLLEDVLGAQAAGQ